jgi:hypothetical protein
VKCNCEWVGLGNCGVHMVEAGWMAYRDVVAWVKERNGKYGVHMMKLLFFKTI